MLTIGVLAKCVKLFRTLPICGIAANQPEKRSICWRRVAIWTSGRETRRPLALWHWLVAPHDGVFTRIPDPVKERRSGLRTLFSPPRFSSLEPLAQNHVATMLPIEFVAQTSGAHGRGQIHWAACSNSDCPRLLRQ